MDDRNDINKFRKKTKRRSLYLRMGVALLAVLVVILIAVNWDRLISPFKDAALEVGSGGFPVALPGSTEYVMDELGDNFYLMTDTYLYTYNSDGANIASIQHGFQNPVSDSNSRRVMIYDRNGKGFKFYSRAAEVYSSVLDDTIVFGSIGNVERCAVVTTSSRYSNYLYVFNGEGRQIFRWASPENKIMQVCFSDNDGSIFVSVIGEKGGELRLSVMRFDLNNAESAIWQTETGSSVTYSLQYTPEGIYVVTEDGALLLDSESGEITARNTFTKSIFGIPETDGLRAVIFNDSGFNGETVVAYNEELAAEFSLTPDRITAFDVSGGRLYLLTGNRLKVYDSSLMGIKEYELDDVYGDVKIIGSNAYLLGYNSVQRQAL
ncbi:MAG: hypothetical protein K2O14_00620 [Oscillospiraceae bacterium]|nr:hypothetical protein [Oscillospiraceae bacterium]